MSDTTDTTEIHTDTSPGTTVQVSPAENVPNADRWTVRLVVLALAVVVVLVIVGQVVLSLKDRTFPPELLVLGGVAVGQLGSMLTSVRSVKG